MKNVEKNSRSKKLLKNLFLFLLIFSLTFGGVYLFFNEPYRQVKKEIEFIKDTSGVKYKDYENHSLEKINEENFHCKESIVKKLKLFNLAPYRKKKFEELLKDLAKEMEPFEDIEQEMLEKKTAEEKKEIIRKILNLRSILHRLEDSVEKEVDLKSYMTEQNEWFAKYYPHGFENAKLSDSKKSAEDKEVIEELKKLFKHFYEEFWKLKNLSRPKIIQPLKTLTGDEVNDETPQEEISRKIAQIKKDYPQLRSEDLMSVEWSKFKGWHQDENPEKGTASIGLTNYTGAYNIGEDLTFVICPWRDISITLDKRFAFGRKGKKYDWWVTKKNSQLRKLRIGWGVLIETIAHELAHAIINKERVYYRSANAKQGGHGTLHHRYTKEIKEMIKDSEEYQKFKAFWFKNS